LLDQPKYQDSAFRQNLAALWGRIARSGALTSIALLLLIGSVTTVYMAHMRGRIHQLITVTEHGGATQVTARPGGQDVLHLFRAERIGSVTPEFSSATLLPGDGMLLLQTTLILPGRGDVPLLQATSDADLAAAGLNVSGAPFSVLAQTRAGTQWLPPVELLAGLPSSQVSNDVIPDGSRAVAHFAAATDPAPVMQQGIEVTVESALSGHGLELTLSARNNSTSPRSLTLSWQPRFLAPLAGMSALTVFAPAGSDNLPTEITLGTHTIDQTYTNLKHSFLSTGPEVRLRNRADGYTLRMTALTPSIRSLHVQASKDGKSVLLAFSTAGEKDGAESRTVVAPGETLEWRVRVEALAESTSAFAPSTQ
jgi:aldose 1-epimerase